MWIQEELLKAIRSEHSISVGHMERIDDRSLNKRICNTEVDVTRERDRSKRPKMVVVKEFVKERGLNFQASERIIRNRNEWNVIMMASWCTVEE